MIDLTKKVLPSCVTVGGRAFPIKTDFHYWIRFTQLIADKSFYTDFDFLYEKEIPENREEGLKALTAFAFPKKELPRETGSHKENIISYDYKIDADLIYAAFMQEYGIDLVESEMHWYKFQALFNGLKDSKFIDVVGYRMYEVKGKPSDYDKQMMKLQRAWEIIPELPEDIQKEMDDFDKLFK